MAVAAAKFDVVQLDHLFDLIQEVGRAFALANSTLLIVLVDCGF